MENSKTEIEIREIVPVFRIFDVGKAKEFYVGYLGFVIDWEHQFEPDTPVYMQVSRAGLVLHLSEHVGDCCPGSTIYVRAAGLESYHRELTAKKYKYLRPGLERTFHGTLEICVIDPFGNRIRFNEELETP